MGLRTTLASWLDPREERLTFVPPPLPSVDTFRPYMTMGGVQYPIAMPFQTLRGNTEPIGTDFVGLASGALKGDAIVWAAIQARVSLFSEARFQFRQLRSGRPGELFGSPALGVLEKPWAGGTTGDLLARLLMFHDLAGDAFAVRLGTRIWCPRPDWTFTVHGSYKDPEVTMWDPEAEVLGYVYLPGGPGSGREPVAFLPRQVAHFAPMPDPLAPGRGMSWLTALSREVSADIAMTEHKAMYLQNGATPNLVVTNVPAATPQAFQDWVAKFKAGHEGVANAYRTLYLSGATDAKVVGNDLAQADFKTVQGAGETRIAAAAGVPAVVLGISEGLAGSSLNAGNFASSMRRFADITMRPLWRNMAGSLAAIVDVPPGSELWFDDRDIAALKDDVKDAAEVQALNAQAIRTLVDAGYEPDSVVDAINAGDLKRLKHSGLYSVQLQPPGTEEPDPEPAAPEPDADDEAEDDTTGRALLALVEAAERRAEAAERRADREPAPQAAPVVNVGSPIVNLPEQAAPVVNVAAPEITVQPSPVEVRNEITVEPTPVTVTNEAAEITVNVPEQAVPDVIVNVPEQRAADVNVTNVVPAVTDIRIVDQPATRKTVKRDPSGLIREVTEEPL